MRTITFDFPQDTLSVDNVQQFVVFSHKFVCIISCSVISQQHSGSGELRFKVFVIAFFLFCIFIHNKGINIHMTYNNNDNKQSKIRYVCD